MNVSLLLSYHFRFYPESPVVMTTYVEPGMTGFLFTAARFVQQINKVGRTDGGREDAGRDFKR